MCKNTAGQRESDEGREKMIQGHTQVEAHQQHVDPHPTKTASQPANLPKQFKHMMSQTSKKTNVDSGRNEKEKGTQEHMFETHRTNTDKHDGEWSSRKDKDRAKENRERDSEKDRTKTKNIHSSTHAPHLLFLLLFLLLPRMPLVKKLTRAEKFAVECTHHRKRVKQHHNTIQILGTK